MIDIKPNHLKMVKEILQKFISNCPVWVFGSRITDMAKNYSDLDLVIVGEAKISYSIMCQIKDEFEESEIPFRIDLLDWNTLSPSFQENIKKKYEILL